MVKPDQLIKRRGKLGLIKVNANLEDVKQWVNQRMGKDIKVSIQMDYKVTEIECSTTVCGPCS